MSENKMVYQNKIAFFQKAEVDGTIQRVYFVTFRPIAPIRDGSTVEFSIPGTSKDMVDLSQSKLYVKFKIVKADGTDIAADVSVFPVNLTLHSLWRQVELLLNQKNVSQSVGTNNPYKCLLDVVLKDSEDVKESVLESELYFKDVNNMDATVISVVQNSGGILQSILRSRLKICGYDRSTEITRSSSTREVDLEWSSHVIPLLSHHGCIQVDGW